MKKILIPLPSRPGELAAIATLMAEAGIDIRSLDADEMEDGEHGVIQMIVDRYDEALRVLRKAGYSTVTEDALLIRVADESGSLAKVAARLSEAGLNVRSLHILRRRGGESLVSLVVDDLEAAREVVGEMVVEGGRGENTEHRTGNFE